MLGKGALQPEDQQINLKTGKADVESKRWNILLHLYLFNTCQSLLKRGI